MVVVGERRSQVAVEDARLASFLGIIVDELDADARSAMNRYRLYPGAPVRDEDGRVPPGLEGHRWARRAVVFGPVEPLDVLDADGAVVATLRPPSSSSARSRGWAILLAAAEP